MNRSKLAILIAVASGLSVAVALADTPRSFTPSAYEYGNYDYYSTSAAAPGGSGAAPAPAPAAPPAAADQAPAQAQAAAPGCSASDSGCSASEPSCGCSSCNSCGCNTCCDCDGCCHEKLPHWITCCRKIEPCFCWDDCCPLCCPDVTTCRHFDDCCWLKCHDTTLTGWFSGGFMGNDDNPSIRFNGPTTFADRDDGQFNQAYAILNRTTDLSKNCGWFIGGDIDFMWGSDFFFTTAAGLDGRPSGNLPRWNTDPRQFYGFAMPQAYVETDYDDLRIKWGHFYTIIGYEVVPDIGNFFYTHSYTMQYGEPFTHTGVLASRNINDNWSWSAGVVSSWNTFDYVGGAQFLGGITYTDKDYGSLAFSIVTGDDSTINLPGIGPYANRTMYSVVWNRTMTSRWSYVLQHDLGVQQDAATLQGTDRAEWYGINQYLFYKINCCWTAGLRFEWFRDDDGFNVTGLRPSNPLVGNFFAGNFYELSFGLNYKPNGNLIIRPELRYDWFDPTSANVGSQQPFNNNTAKTQFLIGLDAIYQW